jgi:hypothetical protein
MTNPNLPDFSVDVPEKVLDASKAVNAALVSLGGLAAVTVGLLADGSFTGADAGTLVTAVLAAATAVGTVFRTTNKPKN